MKTAYFHIIQDCLDKLPVTLAWGQKPGTIVLDFSLLHSLRWKGKPLGLSVFAETFSDLTGVSVQGQEVLLEADLNESVFETFYRRLLGMREAIAKENLNSPKIWPQPFQMPSGFSESQPSLSKNLLEELYQDGFISKEKKALVLDLERCTDSCLVSIPSSSDPEGRSVLDGAAQIASLAVGFNHPVTRPMALRSEVFSSELNLENWDVTQAFIQLLKNESQLPYAYILSSGAEAVEAGFRACQIKYPNRKRIIAFEGSFHGRSFLALHATHSPAKRKPFEVFPELVDFVPFPETKDPNVAAPEPNDWLKIWSQPENKDFLQKIEPYLISSDLQLQKECLSLLKIRASLLHEKPLAVILEPMQCEGGDRYSTPRFFRGLRVLTRALETPLMFDEIQTGFGLGGPFFWAQNFNLVKVSGEPDTVDVISCAKKAQVGVCLSAFPQDLKIETSAASIYRGYLQAVEIKNFNSSELAAKVKIYLDSIQEALKSNLVRNPRNKGLAFAFDLPDATLLNQLVDQRFPNGVLFYSAGDVTARFRLMASTTDAELHRLFQGIYRCFVSLYEKGSIGKIPTEAEWLKGEWTKKLTPGGPPQPASQVLKPEWIPQSFEDYLKISAETWQDIFHTLGKNFPQLLKDSWTLRMPLHSIESLTPKDLWKVYLENRHFTLLDLLWQSSRAFGYQVRRFSAEKVLEHLPKISRLEELLYEPARRDDPKFLHQLSQDPKTIFLGCEGLKGSEVELAGICVAAPLTSQNFKSVKMVGDDPLLDHPQAFYSADLSIHPDFQSKGLGFRLKCEQYIEAYRQGVEWIRSRNRQPEAQTMIRLNQSLGAVVVAQNSKDYGGQGSALYQSIYLHPASVSKVPQTPGQDGVQLRVSKKTSVEEIGVKSPYLGALRNKFSLANFVSHAYISNLLLIKELLPPPLRSIYLSSGRCEAVDKMLKVLRFRKPTGRVVLSFEGDYFGGTTAGARSLGGKAGMSYFPWPRIPQGASHAQIAKEIDSISADKVWGFFVEPMSELNQTKKDTAYLKGLIEVCHERKIPVIFHETASSFYRYSQNNFFCSNQSELDVDGMILYCGAQLGLAAMKKSLFLEQPLMMISTWDGDEHSLNLFRERVFEKWKERSHASP